MKLNLCVPQQSASSNNTEKKASGIRGLLGRGTKFLDRMRGLENGYVLAIPMNGVIRRGSAGRQPNVISFDKYKRYAVTFSFYFNFFRDRIQGLSHAVGSLSLHSSGEV